MGKPKYENLAQVRAAYQSGAIPPGTPLFLDNDATSLYVDDEPVYEGGGPMELFEEALDLLGIPHEPV